MTLTNRILAGIKATYNFFVGDMFILVGVVIAFLLAFVLARQAHAPSALVAIVFLAIIIGSLVLTLSRELYSKKR